MPSPTWAEHRRLPHHDLAASHDAAGLACFAAFAKLVTPSLKQLARQVLMEADPASGQAQGQEWRKLLTESFDGRKLPPGPDSPPTPQQQVTPV